MKLLICTVTIQKNSILFDVTNRKASMCECKFYSKNQLVVILIALIVVTGCKEVKEKEPEVLLVGVFHKVADSLKCNWESAYQAVLHYQPDQIAVEYNKPLDSASHIFTLGRNWATKLDSLQFLWDGQKTSALDTIKKYSGLPKTQIGLKSRKKLWKYYYLNADIANRDYQSYLIHKNSYGYGKSLDTLNNFNLFFNKGHENIVKRRKESEFFNLIFPLAENLGIPYIEPTDNKSTYALQSEAFEKLKEEIKDTLAWNTFSTFWEDFQEEVDSKLSTCNALKYVNSTPFLEKSDYGQAHIFDDRNSKNFKAYADIWYRRNRFIGDNIIELIEKKNAKRVAVFYGYMHIYPVKKYLEEKGYKVKLLTDLD